MSDGLARAPVEVIGTQARLCDAWRQLAEALQARVDQQEVVTATAGAVAEVLQLPGVKMWMLSRFHPDKHPDAERDERELLAATFQKIVGAYQIIEHGK